MKKVFLSLITVFMVLSLSVVLVKANETTTVALEDGVQIRTDGNNGLRWQATVTNPQEGQTYGFLFAQGEIADLTVETANVVNQEVTVLNEDGTFAATMVKFPKAAATQDISVKAYVKVGEEYIYSTNTVVRNLSEVAVAAYETKGLTEGFVKEVYDASETKLNLNGGSFIADYSFNVTRYNTGSSTGYYIGMAPSDTPSNATGLYWDRILLKFDEVKGLYKVVGVRASGVSVGTIDYDYIIGAHNSCYDKTGKSVITKFVTSETNFSNYYAKFEVPTSTTCDVAIELFSDYELFGTEYHFGGGEKLPTLEKEYYDFAGWYNNPECNGTAINVQGKDRTLYAKFELTSYTISYNIGNGNCSSTLVSNYNYETPTFVLPTADEMTIEEGQFGGWYDNEIFSGDPITHINVGSYGNKILYAKWIMNAPTEVTLSSSEEAIFNQTNPTIIVDKTFTSGKYMANEIVYEAGKTAFSSVVTALSVAKENDVIYVFGGTYTGDLTISVANITLVGPNYNVSYDQTRNSEATISGMINVGANGFTIDGFTYTGSGKAIKVTAIISNLTIKNNLISATGASTQGGRVGIIGSDSSINGLTFVNNSLTCTGSAGKNAFAIYGTLTNANISNNSISNGAGSGAASNSELIRSAYIAGTFNFDNNVCLWGTKNYSIYVGSSSNKCTSISISNNELKGSTTATSTTICVRNIGANVTFDFIGNKFENFDSGSTLDFRYGNALCTINIKDNVFGTKVNFEVIYIGDGTINWSNNTYTGGISTENKVTPGDYIA